MRLKNNMWRFWVLLLIVTAVSCGLYYLPRKPLGITLKPIDLLSDLRERAKDSIVTKIVADADFMAHRKASHSSDSAGENLRIRDSVYSALRREQSDTAVRRSVYFEDYSSAHDALRHFYQALARRNNLGRPVRIAFVGDSFIEGDVFTSDVRRLLCSRLGGSGVGWLPLTSEVAGFRRSVRHTFSGWNTHNMLHAKRGQVYPFPGYYYTAQAGARVGFCLPGDSGVRNTAHRITFYYRSQDSVPLTITFNKEKSERLVLPPAGEIVQYKWATKAHSVSLSFPNPPSSFIAYGLSLEGDSGITVDNFSLRGNSGLLFGRVDETLSGDLGTLRPYDLVVLQYGLNVAEAQRTDYSYYVKQMKKLMPKIRGCFPGADILIMSVSDRGERRSGEVVTMPAIPALVAAQQDLARSCGIAFWNTYAAMGGAGSIAAMAARGLAAKDYTHLGFAGGRIVADAFVKALFFEQKYYDAFR